MKNIRDLFQADLDRSLKLAKSLVALEIFGENQLEKLIKNDPEHKISMGVGTSLHPDIEKVLTKDLLTELQSNPGIVQEIVHGYLIQVWYEFLGQIFQAILHEHFCGPNDYSKLPKINVQLDLAISNSSNIVSNIEEKAANWFEHEKNHEKINKIEKYLEISIDENLKQRIKKYIIVRNVIQHNRGVLRDQDLETLGRKGGNITLINDSQQHQAYTAGERVMISYWEVEALKNDLYEASNQLIPGDSEST
ncbi:hypothetical protein [Laspinema olomoucense]|uniref:RiboL-PSP-HEPN domain-containing protein n=1 Tax=Laspinema olomoucense D3b TaxID=2953688 RepID=A0ABT2NEK2_9CYAN|nr:hypothetical protein [Laspinema sp. D3b]MCT7979760.1 hypothetical protein [Laspinema sp. D3b]